MILHSQAASLPAMHLRHIITTCGCACCRLTHHQRLVPHPIQHTTTHTKTHIINTELLHCLHRAWGQLMQSGNVVQALYTTCDTASICHMLMQVVDGAAGVKSGHGHNEKMRCKNAE